MKVLRGLLVAAVLLVAASTFGAAANLGGLAAAFLGAGGSAVATCDSDGVAVSYTVVGGAVTEVIVSNLAAACAGGELSLTLTDATNAAVGSGGPVTVVGNPVTVAVNPQPSAGSVAALHIVIEGP